jgi:hypothetical protein
VIEHLATSNENCSDNAVRRPLVFNAIIRTSIKQIDRCFKALELLEHVVAVRERMLAEEHPDRLTS